jgi:hypothetical protein
MLVLNNEEWDNIVKCNPKGKKLYWPLLMIDKKTLSSLSLLKRMWEGGYEPEQIELDEIDLNITSCNFLQSVHVKKK